MWVLRIQLGSSARSISPAASSLTTSGLLHFHLFLVHLLKGIYYTYLLCVLCMRAMVYLGRSENNLRESVLSFTMWIPVIEHRLLDLAIGALTL